MVDTNNSNKIKVSKLFDRLISITNELDNMRYDRMEGYDNSPLNKYFTKQIKLIKSKDELIAQIELISNQKININDLYKSKKNVLNTMI